MNAHPWTEISSEPLTEALLRSLFPQEQGYRIFPNRHEAGVKSPSKIARATRLYVLEGVCSYRMDDRSVEVNAGEYADLPPGMYEFEVPATSPVKLIRVYRLPELDKTSTQSC